MSRNKSKKHKRKKPNSQCNDVRELGFVMLVFGVVTICAFVLPVKAWILLLGAILFFCGLSLYCK